MVALFLVACCGGMLPICNLAMISSAFLALSGDFNTDTVNLTTMIMGNLIMMSLALPLVSYLQRGLGLRLALLFTLALLFAAGTGTALSTRLPGLGFGYALLGLGGCLFLGLSSRIITAIAPPELRRLLLLIWAFSVGFSSSLSPLLGGVLVEHLTWRSLFFLTPLVTLPCMFIVLFLAPDLRPGPLPKLDRLSFVFLLVLASCSVFAVCQGQSMGWDSLPIQTLIFISVSALALFIASCIASSTPFLYIRNFGFRGVGPALVLAVVLVTVHVGIRVEVILYGRNILGYTPSQIGLLFLVPLGCYLIALLPTAIIVSHTGLLKPFTFAGLGLLITASLLLSRLDANVWNISIILALSLDYMGFAMVDATLTPLILRNIPPEKQAETLPAISCFRFFAITITIGALTPLNVQLKQFYLTRLASQVTASSPATMGTISHWEQVFIAGGSVPAQARHDALSIIESSITKQASVFTFDHIFLIFALLSALGVVCVLFCRRHAFADSWQLAVASLYRQTRTLRERLAALSFPAPPSPALLVRRIRQRLTPPAALLLFLLPALCLGGCTLGPDYNRPAMDLPGQSAHPPGALFLSDRWWEVFDDPALNRLVEQTLAANLDLEQALARVEVARAEAGIAFADRLPAAELEGGASRRQMTEGEKLVHHYDSRIQANYYAMPALSFELDLWGKYRRTDEAARAALLATEAARDTVRLSLAAETARTYFLLRTLQAQYRLTADMVASYDRTCQVYGNRFRQGLTPETTFRRFVAERARTKAMLLRYEQERIQAEGLLAVLAGFTPREIIEEAQTRLARGKKLLEITLPPDIPSGLPSNLLRRRPDIRAAEGGLMAANALIGARMADFFPSFSLTGNAGYTTTDFNNFVMGTTGVWSMGGGLNLPLFEGGRLVSGLRRQEALYDEARAAYLKGVQDAFRETRDALAGIRISRESYTVNMEQVRALTRSHNIMTRQYDEGLTSVMDLLDVRRQLLAAQQDSAEARRRQLDSVVLLCKAMGGGWSEQAGFGQTPGTAGP